MPKPTSSGASPKPPPPAPLQVRTEPGIDNKLMLARTALRPSVRAAVTAQTYSKQFGELDLTALVDELTEQIALVDKGDMRRPEAMLVAQAHTLDLLFHELVRRATANMGEYVNAAEIYMRLALKAQGQCRATLEALAEMKNPRPMTFVKQANVTHGPQQVNNGLPQTSAHGEFGQQYARTHAHAWESENQPNKLLEQDDGERLEFGAPPTAIGADTALATVG